MLLWAHYEWNKIYISKVLCEDKNVPDSCCKGKCFLKKQVKKQEENPSTTTNNTSKEQKSIKTAIEEVIIDNPIYHINQNQGYCCTYKQNMFDKSSLLRGYSKSIEKPPMS